jgi:hypothetical protein
MALGIRISNFGRKQAVIGATARIVGRSRPVESVQRTDI